MNFKTICFTILLLSPLVFSTSRMEMKIQPKDSDTIEQRIVTSDSFATRPDSSPSYFLIFFDKDPNNCDQQAYINIAAPTGEFLHKGRYDNISGQQVSGMTQPLLDFYYTEPNGARYPCLDNAQTGFFDITELKFNNEGGISEIGLNFEIHCIVNGQPEKRAVTGTLTHKEDGNNILTTRKVAKFLE